MSTRKIFLDEGVSPVVGVMLMLVVTIVIAAVVSAFSGGLTSDTKKTPQMSIKATYSNSTGMTISHQGGDTVNTLTTNFIVSPSSDFGSYDQLRWNVNSSVIFIRRDGSDKPWNDPSKSYTSQLARTFQGGDTATISVSDLSQVQPGTYTTNTDASGRLTDAFYSGYGFDYPTAMGQRFNLQLVDDSGKTIAQTEVTIVP